MKRRIIIEVDDEIVERKANECGCCEELTGLCHLAAPKEFHQYVDEARLTALLTEHGITVISDKPVEDLPKFDNDAAVQVAEEAFRAGFQSAVNFFFERGGYARNVTDVQLHQTMSRGWYNFEPSEDIKELVE